MKDQSAMESLADRSHILHPGEERQREELRLFSCRQ
jgi:hypothetical protein